MLQWDAWKLQLTLCMDRWPMAEKATPLGSYMRLMVHCRRKRNQRPVNSGAVYVLHIRYSQRWHRAPTNDSPYIRSFSAHHAIHPRSGENSIIRPVKYCYNYNYDESKQLNPRVCGYPMSSHTKSQIYTRYDVKTD